MHFKNISKKCPPIEIHHLAYLVKKKMWLLFHLSYRYDIHPRLSYITVAFKFEEDIKNI